VYCIIDKANGAKAFHFSPATFAIMFPQTGSIMDAGPSRNWLNISDIAKDFKVHQS